MREIVWDTETTGSDFEMDRLVEVGLVEMRDGRLTGEVFHRYIRPPIAVHREAVKVHGLTDQFLRDKPDFPDVVDALMTFIDAEPDTLLVAHNSEFDRKMLNAELRRVGRPEIPKERTRDTMAMARKRHPGSPASLDALCRRYKIDASRRTQHGALLDAELLAEVYVELNGGRQHSLDLDSPDAGGPGRAARAAARREARVERTPRVHAPSAAELDAHAAFIANHITDPIWHRAPDAAE